MRSYRNFIPYYDYCKDCMPYLYGRRGCEPWHRGVSYSCSGYDCSSGCCQSCTDFEKKGCQKQCACERFKDCHCPRQEVMYFASFVNADKCALKCGDAIKFKRVLASEGCGWKCSSDCIELSRGAYMIFVSGLQSNKCGGTLAICCNDERVKGGHTYLSSSCSPFCINVMLKIEKCANISVRNISDSIINIELAKLNVLRLV